MDTLNFENFLYIFFNMPELVDRYLEIKSGQEGGDNYE